MRVWLECFPGEHAEEVKTLADLLSEANNLLHRFESAADLFAFTYQQRAAQPPPDGEALSRLFRWQLVACRDGAVNIWNFHQCLKGIGFAVHRIPTIEKHLPSSALRKLMKDFEEVFPEVEHVRDAVCHSACKLKTPKSRKFTMLHGDHVMPGLTIKNSTNVMVSEMVYGVTYSTTHKNFQPAYTIDRKSYDALASYCERLKAFFSPFYRGSDKDPRRQANAE